MDAIQEIKDYLEVTRVFIKAQRDELSFHETLREGYLLGKENMTYELDDFIKYLEAQNAKVVNFRRV